jgi:rhamnosyltransferase
MATYNGIAFIAEQVASILGQEGVDVRLVVSDDGSADGTVDWLADLAAREPRVTILPKLAPSGSSAANFYRLLRDADPAPGELVALADQDDVWLAHKLRTQAALLADSGADAVSGSVVAFDASGAEHLIRKDYPQRRLDWVVEGPGPGSTFLMTPRLIALARDVLAHVPEVATATDHDWLLYSIGRARGWGWHIGGEPLVRYRQHAANVIGANRGARAAASRLSMIRSRWHREQAIVHAVCGIYAAPEEYRAEIAALLPLLRSTRVRDRWRLARLAPQLRRRPRDRFIIGALIRSGVW